MIGRRRGLALLLAGALAATSCELLGDETVTSALNDVQSQTGVDFRDPVSVGQAAIGANTIGNKDAEDGLDVVKGFERADHEQKGDAFARMDPPQMGRARDEWNQALRWSQEETVNVPFLGPTSRTLDPSYAEQLRNKRGALYSRIGLSYSIDGDALARADTGGAGARAHYRRAADAHAKAAEAFTTSVEKGKSYRDQAEALLRAGDNASACAALETAKSHDSRALNQGFDGAVARQAGCK